MPRHRNGAERVTEPRSVTTDQREHYTDKGVTATANDDLMTRAEKIVWLLGFRGAIGGHAVDVFRLLQAYEKLDRDKAAAKTES